MRIDEVAPERLAESFHHYCQELEVFGKEGKKGSWKEMTELEKNRFVAAARLALLELDSAGDEAAKSHQPFAEPGEAEWGC